MNKTEPGFRIVTFYSTHHALRAEKLLKKEGINVKAITVPRHISSDCGIAFKFTAEHEKKIDSILKENSIEVHGFHDI